MPVLLWKRPDPAPYFHLFFNFSDSLPPCKGGNQNLLPLPLKNRGRRGGWGGASELKLWKIVFAFTTQVMSPMVPLDKICHSLWQSTNGWQIAFSLFSRLCYVWIHHWLIRYSSKKMFYKLQVLDEMITSHNRSFVDISVSLVTV